MTAIKEQLRNAPEFVLIRRRIRGKLRNLERWLPAKRHGGRLPSRQSVEQSLECILEPQVRVLLHLRPVGLDFRSASIPGGFEKLQVGEQVVQPTPLRALHELPRLFIDSSQIDLTPAEVIRQTQVYALPLRLTRKIS